MNSNRYFFKKKLRLVNWTDFHSVFNQSKKNENSICIILSKHNKLSFPRIGIIVSKKVSKYACRRNLIKRLIREVFRIIQYRLLHCDFVIIAKKKILKMNKKEIFEFLKNLFIQKFSKKI